MVELPSLLLAALLHSGCQTALPDPCVLVLLGGGVGQLAKGLEVVDEFWCLTDPEGVGFHAGVLCGMCRSVDHRGVAKFQKGHQRNLLGRLDICNRGCWAGKVVHREFICWACFVRKPYPFDHSAGKIVSCSAR
jgi:hypothetical protein